MALSEVGIRIDYFHKASDNYLRLLGVDRTRLPAREAWFDTYAADYARAIEKRETFQLVWLSGELPIGFSSVDQIEFGASARMHLHVLDADSRNKGVGARCVIESVRVYFECLKLKKLFCEPNAYNVAPNRTLQTAGFKYLKTYETVPGPINYRQAVTRWVFEPSY